MGTEKRWDVLGMGVTAVDDLLYIDRFPRPDTKIPVREAHRQGGGLTATALVAAARQGARAAYCGVIGSDDLSLYALAELEREGVDCSPSERSPRGHPYHSTVIVERGSGTRTILYQPGEIEPSAELITEELISSCRVLYIEHHVPTTGLLAAKYARLHGIPVVADVETTSFPEREAFLKAVDHLIVGKTLAQELTGKSQIVEMVRALSGPERACAVVTDGERGCWFAERGGEPRAVAGHAVQVVDTTGCGDVFHGAYAAAIARGESPARAVEVANAAAAIKATQAGGRAGIPDLKTVEAWLDGVHPRTRARGA